jgi:hypothetical protein
MRAIVDRWQRALLVALAGLGLAQVGYAFLAGAPGPSSFGSVCALWDHQASASISMLASEAGALQLDDALRQLTQARENCRSGRIGLAHQDYAVLRAGQSFWPGFAIGSSAAGVTFREREADR